MPSPDAAPLPSPISPLTSVTSPLTLADRLLTLAQDADRAGYRDAASHLVHAMFSVLDHETLQ